MVEAQKLYSKNIDDEYSPPNKLSFNQGRKDVCPPYL